jgi:K+-transporting ATPase ATPase C chain
MRRKIRAVPCVMLSLRNAELQLEWVASKWAADLKRDPVAIREEIKQMLQSFVSSLSDEPAGEPFVNVLGLNLELRRRYGRRS